jgi:pyruvate dehydrogenase E2 component (dihydrolipoamide acetyltransferase)
MDDVLKLREQINATFADDKSKKLSVNDFIILASAKALKDVPAANASWTDNAIMMYNNVDISVAVAIDGGLITPIIKNADQKDITKISSEMKDLAKRARENSLSPEEFQGGGFSISNLGMYGIKNFSAIINPPQGCIMAVGASSKRPVVINDKLEIRTIMVVTIE